METPEKLKEGYLDEYEGIQSEILSTTRFNENSGLSMTYLGRVKTTKTSKIKVELKGGNFSRKYILLDSLLFKIVTTPEKETALLAIPEICTDKIITPYYSSLLAGHQGVIKTDLKINNKFFIPNLIHYL